MNSNKIKSKLVPLLRFPEFQDEPPWKKMEVGKIFDVTRGQVLAMPLVHDIKSTKMPYPVYSSRTQNNGLSGFYSEYLFEDAITWTTDGANAGDVNFRQGKFFCTNVCGVLVNSDGYANPCIAAILNSVTKKHVSYVGNPKLMNGVMSKIQIPIPSIPEQQKIADCLTSLNDLITAETQKLESLQAYKKGLLQNLFPAEGETLPALRFPEFQDAPAWKQRRLKNISPAVFDGTHQTPTYTTEGVPFFSVENLITGNKNKFISHDDYLIATQKNKPEKGDILLTRIGQLGYTQVVTWDYEFSVYVTLAVIKSSDSFDSYYLHSLMQSSYYQNEIRKNALLIAVPPKINMDSLRETKVILPKLPEQQKIATCLSALDDQITCQKSQIETLQAHKKGLLQQLFPSSEEDMDE